MSVRLEPASLSRFVPRGVRRTGGGIHSLPAGQTLPIDEISVEQRLPESYLVRDFLVSLAVSAARPCRSDTESDCDSRLAELDIGR